MGEAAKNNTEASETPIESNAILVPKTVEKKPEEADPIKVAESAGAEEKTAEQEEKILEQTKQVLEGQKAPEKYELKLPEGSHLKTDHLEKIATYAKERGLSNEDAQKLLERENSVLAGFVEDQKQQLKTTTETWMKEVEGDKEIGGAAYKESVAHANSVVKKFGSPSFIKTLNETGLGNHPELVRVFARIGKLMANDQLVTSAQPSKNPKSIEERFYGSSTKGE